MSANFIVVCGRVSTDVTLRDVNGTSCASFGLAVDTEAKDESGKYVPMFYSVNVWRARGETCAKHLGKGERVTVMGNLSQRAYVDKDGKDRVQNKITASTVEFQGGVKTRESQSADSEDLPF